MTKKYANNSEVKEIMKIKHLGINFQQTERSNDENRKEHWTSEDDFILEFSVLLLDELGAHQNFKGSMKNQILSILEVLFERSQNAINVRMYEKYNLRKPDRKNIPKIKVQRRWDTQSDNIVETFALFLLEIQTHMNYNADMKYIVLQILQTLSSRSEDAVKTRLYKKGYLALQPKQEEA